MKHALLFTILLACISLIGCASSRISTLPISDKLIHPVKAIALAPDGGLLADAVGVELSNKGFTVIDSVSTSRLMVRLNLNEIEIARPEGLAKLKDQGIDAFLVVRSAGSYDQQPQSASVRVNSTYTGQVIAGISWQNGWGGQAGSIADRTMRKGLAETAADIANALIQTIRPH
ncbi:MAG: hypothetical protein J0649_04530 [Methylococcales bacterium]|jgi:hypothetical protein|nr:hypothetical protein [Methylococcales bacterium]